MTYIRTLSQLGPLLKDLRRRKQLTQTQLGARLGLSQERIAKIEKHPERVTFNQLFSVLMALDAEISVNDRATQPNPAGAKDW
jgi:HTH-type transcriptional regulator / antitoxin HipB